INTTQLQQGRVSALSNNGGNLIAQVNITDVSLLPTDEFQVRLTGGNFIMTNLTNQTTTNLGAPGGPGTVHNTPFGFEFIENSGAANADDSFTITPSKNSAALMKVTLADGSAIAASSAVGITPSQNNVSAGEINIVDMFDPVNAQAAMPMRVDVSEDAFGVFTYTITDNTNTTSAPVVYTPPSQVIDLPPLPSTATFQVEISGKPSGSSPNAPEQFFIGDAFGVGNGSNAVDMAKTQEIGVTNGGKETFSKSLAVSTSVVGSKASNANLTADTAQALFTQAYNRNQATSGVNLDEEAANLLKYQQAYQAASQIISTANTIFDTILSAVR
ncbi:MAG: flagellar hook-associated protein FlgK, partial [Alteromonadales bacterium]|nr:flagellar hook-associated protein FlgK [Alteromonadales bacterium]